MIDSNRDFKTIVISASTPIRRFARSARGRGLIYWAVREKRDGELDLKAVLTIAARFGLKSILVEGGASVATSFLEAGLVDKYVCVIAPNIIGRGTEAVGDLGIKSLKNALKLNRWRIEPVGKDFVITAYLEKKR